MRTEQEIREILNKINQELKSIHPRQQKLQAFYMGQVVALRHILDEIEE